MSSHPTSAELAAFRRTLKPRWFEAFDHPCDHPEGPNPPRWCCLLAGPNRTERDWGVPVQNGYTNRPRMIREANRMRREAFERIAFEACGDAGLAFDLDAAMLTFAGSYAEYHEGHGGAAGSFWPDCPLCPPPHVDGIRDDEEYRASDQWA